MNVLEMIRRLIESEDAPELSPEDQESYEFNCAAALSDMGFPILF